MDAPHEIQVVQAKWWRNILKSCIAQLFFNNPQTYTHERVDAADI